MLCCRVAVAEPKAECRALSVEKHDSFRFATERREKARVEGRCIRLDRPSKASKVFRTSDCYTYSCSPDVFNTTCYQMGRTKSSQ